MGVRVKVQGQSSKVEFSPLMDSQEVRHASVVVFPPITNKSHHHYGLKVSVSKKCDAIPITGRT